MALSIRRLVIGDEATLASLADDDADFDLPGKGKPRPPLSDDEAHRYLADPSVIHWVAEIGDELVGHLQGYVLHKRTADGVEVILYEVGVRIAHRRRGVGRALVETLLAWTDERGLGEVWVLADHPGAMAFYRSCGFEIGEGPPVFMNRVNRSSNR
jgi:GNAT superfamily N-acetyltransferase